MTLNDRQITRLLSYIDTSGDCWEWTGPSSTDLSGHLRGSFYANGHRRQATVVVWEHLVGIIPDGLELDHLCRYPICVNPDHLEPVTHAENQRRGFGPPGLAARKTRCVRGHPYSARNTRIDSRGYRECRECRSIWDKAYRQRRAS